VDWVEKPRLDTVTLASWAPLRGLDIVGVNRPIVIFLKSRGAVTRTVRTCPKGKPPLPDPDQLYQAGRGFPLGGISARLHASCRGA